MTEIADVLVRGGPVALVVGLAVAAKYILEALATYRRSKGDTPVAQPTDGATANVIALDALREERSALRAEREDSRSKDARIDALESENTELRDQIHALRSEYEGEIRALRSKIQDVTYQLEGLQARLRENLPPGNALEA